VDELKDRYLNNKCVICGNGPSLTEEVLAVLKEKRIFTFVVNGFSLILDKVDFIPDVVCMSNFDAINKYGDTYPKETLKFFKVGWQNQYIVKKNIENVYELPFNCNHDQGSHDEQFIKDGHFTTNPFKHNYCGETVVLDFAIPLAFYMGFRNIYLCGVDCDYSKGYFSKDYQLTATKDFKGMINGDDSIAIPSYQYAKQFLNTKQCNLFKLTESEPLDFIEFKHSIEL